MSDTITTPQGQTISTGDRVRIIDGFATTGFMRDGEVWSPVGSYGTVKIVPTMGIFFTLENDGDNPMRFCVNSAEIALAPLGSEPPVVVVHPEPAGASDVTLVEHELSGAYSMYKIGNWRGTATLWHGEDRWQVTFSDDYSVGIDQMLTVGSAEHPNTAAGAWDVWNAASSARVADRERSQA